MADRPSLHVTNFSQSYGASQSWARLTNDSLVSGLPKKYCQRISPEYVKDGGEIKERIVSFTGRNWGTNTFVRYICVSLLHSFMSFFLSEVKLPLKIGFLSMNSPKVNSWRVKYSWRPSELHACIKWGIDTQMHLVNQITRNRIYMYENWRYKTCIKSFNKLISTKIICWQLFASGFLTLGS